MNKTLTAPFRGMKSLTTMVFRRFPNRIWGSARTRLGWRAEREVGDGTSSSAVMAVLNWITNTFPEAPPMLWKVDDKGQEEQEPKHPILRLLTRPNEYYTGEDLWTATLIDYHATGDAYWFKIRKLNSNEIAELWWCPSILLEPKGDENEFITHYIYSVDGEEKRIEAEDVIHFRNGMDPDDQKHGRSPIAPVLAEVMTDEEASRFTSSLLRNSGVPGIVISPKDPNAVPSPDDAALTKEKVMQQTTGDQRGEPLVMTGPTEVVQFGFSPQQMDLRTVRRIPEERITAVLGVPAIVAGLGAGLDRSTFANMKEAREAAYEGKMIPLQRAMASTVKFQLLPDYGEDPWDWRFGFDLSVVRVLQEDEDALVKRMDVAIQGGWATVAEGRRAMGLDVEDGHEIFLRPVNREVVPADAPKPDPDEEQEEEVVDDQITPPAPEEEDDDAEPGEEA